MREVEGEGVCWEGVEMTTSPDQFASCSWNTWVCGIRVRTGVGGGGLDPPQW